MHRNPFYWPREKRGLEDASGNCDFRCGNKIRMNILNCRIKLPYYIIINNIIIVIITIVIISIITVITSIPFVFFLFFSGCLKSFDRVYCGVFSC